MIETQINPSVRSRTCLGCGDKFNPLDLRATIGHCVECSTKWPTEVTEVRRSHRRYSRIRDEQRVIQPRPGRVQRDTKPRIAREPRNRSAAPLASMTLDQRRAHHAATKRAFLDSVRGEWRVCTCGRDFEAGMHSASAYTCGTCRRDAINTAKRNRRARK